jgi:hypothetical protein
LFRRKYNTLVGVEQDVIGSDSSFDRHETVLGRGFDPKDWSAANRAQSSIKRRFMSRIGMSMKSWKRAW